MTTKQDLERQLQEVTEQINRLKGLAVIRNHEQMLIKSHERNRAILVSKIMDLK